MLHIISIYAHDAIPTFIMYHVKEKRMLMIYLTQNIFRNMDIIP